MSTLAPHVDIPFCPQQRLDGAERTCGAAALMMVYGSFNSRPRLADVWRSVAQPGPNGPRVPTHRLAADAIASGRPAVCLKSGHDPAECLRWLLDAGWRVIVNHLFDPQSHEGHFSVLLDVDAHAVVLHDPLRGPSRRVTLPRFLDDWLPASPTEEVPGGMLVAIGATRFADSNDDRCPECALPFPLPPELGVGWETAWNRRWQAAFCPHCDACVVPTWRPVTQDA